MRGYLDRYQGCNGCCRHFGEAQPFHGSSRGVTVKMRLRNRIRSVYLLERRLEDGGVGRMKYVWRVPTSETAQKRQSSSNILDGE
jgi:hypothetical protein